MQTFAVPRRRLIAAAALLSLVPLAPLVARHADVGVIVQTVRGSGAAAERAVERSGGTVTRDLPIVDGFSARVPAGALATLRHEPGVRAITFDRIVVPLEDAAPPATPNAENTATMRAPEVWSAGYTGAGVTVAVIDTGVSEVPDLAGRIVPVTDDATGVVASCVNFSGEPGCQDSYGHGTFVAGVVAGNGASSGGRWSGVAPGARIVAVKLSGRDGAADVSTLLAAIQWVVSYRDRYGIRVLNLSVGSDSPQSYRIDPLNYAVERAWRAGIVVVTSASNRGPNPATITKPADDPWVVTVGAIDDRGTAGTSDDTVPNFSGRGPTLADAVAKPDLVAPGAHIVGLRAPGSALDEAFPRFVGDWYRKGSGTSFAAPAVAGTVALMLERDPSLLPDRVKHALVASARATASADPYTVGAGLLDAAAGVLATPEGTANQGLAFSDGSGSLDASRGTLRVETIDVLGGTVTISGELTQQLALFDRVGYTTLEWTGASWQGASWQGASWQGASWQGASWQGASWQGASWQGASWQGASWQSADGGGSDDAWYGTPGLAGALYGAWE